MKNSKISKINFYRALSKISKPLADSTHQINEIAFYIIEIQLKDGFFGQGYLLSFDYSKNAIEGTLKDICDFALGYDVYETVKIKEDWDKEAEYFGNTGLQNCSIAALNIAMWDAWAKILDKPIWKILGSNARKIPVYGSGGWLSYSEEELVEEVLEYKKRGFKAVKIKVGSESIEKDLYRLAKCREALGNEIKIMIDANQGMDVPSALELSAKAKKYNIHWFEEPISHKDFDGYKLLRQKNGIALAMGEREYDLEALKTLIAKNAIDLWQPDIIRIGGVEGWLNSAAVADAYNIPVLPHYYKDYDVPLLSTVSSPYGAESFDWINDIIDNTMKIEAGYAYPRDKAGWGFEFKKEFLQEVK
ncbi:MAG: mandelate racemase/muconate lactonizing enzyme family protein [Firmicutes bacterium]|nr:mandelate racemase/muconate lactonizing enzyme family protein [Bacillota bacterium]